MRIFQPRLPLSIGIDRSPLSFRGLVFSLSLSFYPELALMMDVSRREKREREREKERERERDRE